MGKGNRERLKRGEDILATSEKNVKQNKKKGSKGIPLWAGNLILCSLALVLVVVIVTSTITSSGIILKLSQYAATDDYTISGPQLSYIFKTIVNQFYEDNQSIIGYIGLNPYTTLKDQESLYQNADGKALTWFEYFAAQAESQAKQLIVLCQMAHNEGLDTLTKEEEEEIEAALTNMELSAIESGYSFSGYIKTAFGAGVSENDIRTVMRYQLISSNFYKVIKERLEGAITEDRVNKYFDEHKKDFLCVDYLSFTISVSKDAVKAEDEASKKEAAEQKYKDDKAMADAYAEKFKAAADAEAFKAVIVEYIMEVLADDLFEEEYTEEFKKLTGDKGHTEEAKKAFKEETLADLKTALLEIDWFAEEEKPEEEEEEEEKEEDKRTDLEKAEDALYDTLLTQYTNQITKAYVKGGYYVEEDELSEWLFDDSRKEKDLKVDADEKDSKDSYTVSANFVTKLPYKDEETTKNVGHILFTKDKYDDPEAKAKEVLSLYIKGEATKDEFEKLGKEYTADSNVFYDNVYKGQMVAEFEEWLFDDERKEGDTGIVKTNYGYHLMYFVGEGQPNWYANVFSTVFSEDYEAWLEEAEKSTNVKLNDSTMNKIDA